MTASNPGMLARLALGAAALLCAASVAHAQPAWKPDGPVTLIVPYPAGGGADAQSRAVGRELQRIWGQTVVVENAPGADGLIGTRRAIEAKTDGHTLLVQMTSMALLKHLPTFKGVDPVTQLTPVAAMSYLPAVFVASAKIPVNSVAELIRYCRGTPCALGTAETVTRLWAQVFKADTGIDNLLIVNYKGSSQVVSDLVANTVNVAITGSVPVAQFHRTGTLRILASAGSKRSPALPDVPSASEAGMPGMDQPLWYGVFAPKGTPSNIVQGVAAAVQQAVRSDEATRTFSGLGAEAIGNTPPEFAAMVAADSERMAAAVKRFPIE